MKLSTLYESDGFKAAFGRSQPTFSADVQWSIGGPTQERSKHPKRWYYGHTKKAAEYTPSKGTFQGKAEKYKEHLL